MTARELGNPLGIIGRPASVTDVIPEAARKWRFLHLANQAIVTSSSSGTVPMYFPDGWLYLPVSGSSLLRCTVDKATGTLGTINSLADVTPNLSGSVYSIQLGATRLVSPQDGSVINRVGAALQNGGYIIPQSGTTTVGGVAYSHSGLQIRRIQNGTGYIAFGKNNNDASANLLFQLDADMNVLRSASLGGSAIAKLNRGLFVSNDAKYLYTVEQQSTSASPDFIAYDLTSLSVARKLTPSISFSGAANQTNLFKFAAAYDAETDRVHYAMIGDYNGSVVFPVVFWLDRASNTFRFMSSEMASEAASFQLSNTGNVTRYGGANDATALFGYSSKSSWSVKDPVSDENGTLYAQATETNESYKDKYVAALAGRFDFRMPRRVNRQTGSPVFAAEPSFTLSDLIDDARTVHNYGVAQSFCPLLDIGDGFYVGASSTNTAEQKTVDLFKLVEVAA